MLQKDIPSQLPLINREKNEHAMGKARKEWERLPWSHVPIDSTQAESPKARFQPPVVQPSLANMYASQRQNPNGFQVTQCSAVWLSS